MKSLYHVFKERVTLWLLNFLSVFFSTYTKRQIVMSSAVQYFGDVDVLDNANIERVNKLLHICNHNYNSMRLPMLMSKKIWGDIQVDMIRTQTVPINEAVDKLYNSLPYWLQYQTVREDLLDVIRHIRSQQLNISLA